MPVPEFKSTSTARQAPPPILAGRTAPEPVRGEIRGESCGEAEEIPFADLDSAARERILL